MKRDSDSTRRADRELTDAYAKKVSFAVYAQSPEFRAALEAASVELDDLFTSLQSSPAHSQAPTLSNDGAHDDGAGVSSP